MTADCDFPWLFSFLSLLFSYILSKYQDILSTLTTSLFVNMSLCVIVFSCSCAMGSQVVNVSSTSVELPTKNDVEVRKNRWAKLRSNSDSSSIVYMVYPKPWKIFTISDLASSRLRTLTRNPTRYSSVRCPPKRVTRMSMPRRSMAVTATSSRRERTWTC